MHLSKPGVCTFVNVCLSIARQAFDAFSWLHGSVGVLHMGVKPGNLLWPRTTSRLVVIDFSLVEPWPVLAGQDPHGVHCTGPFRPPELSLKVHRTLLTGLVRPAVDWLSMGCIVWLLRVGQMRISGSSEDYEKHRLQYRYPEQWLPPKHQLYVGCACDFG